MNDWKEKIAFKGDKILWYIVIMLMIASVMVVYSSTGRLAYNEKAGNTFFYLIKQLFLIGGCFGVMFIVQSIHYRYFYKYAGVLLFVSMILLVCAAFGGTNINGAGRWIRLPLIGLTFQPSELAKIAIMMFTARILSEAQTDTHCDDSVLQKFLLFVGPVILLIFMEFLYLGFDRGSMFYPVYDSPDALAVVGDDLGNRFGGDCFGVDSGNLYTSGAKMGTDRYDG